jgi:hypothetical protein
MLCFLNTHTSQEGGEDEIRKQKRNNLTEKKTIKKNTLAEEFCTSSKIPNCSYLVGGTAKIWLVTDNNEL